MTLGSRGFVAALKALEDSEKPQPMLLTFWRFRHNHHRDISGDPLVLQPDHLSSYSALDGFLGFHKSLEGSVVFVVFVHFSVSSPLLSGFSRMMNFTLAWFKTLFAAELNPDINLLKLSNTRSSSKISLLHAMHVFRENVPANLQMLISTVVPHALQVIATRFNSFRPIFVASSFILLSGVIKKNAPITQAQKRAKHVAKKRIDSLFDRYARSES
ncbi:hypothetical protein [Novipirellula maiorica]|uniref:hypothetical protein n=1 Tax=Novipirellula maiorica TaxID=1265734 RepID=UPI001181C0EA|nr:hypothetical protein [Rhodopirellula maiorica]